MPVDSFIVFYIPNVEDETVTIMRGDIDGKR